MSLVDDLKNLIEWRETVVRDGKGKFDVYLSLDEIKDIVSALEKQIPKKPTTYYKSFSVDWSCPACGRTHRDGYLIEYCRACGQAIDWSEE